MLNIIRPMATRMPTPEMTLIQMNRPSETVRRSRRTMVRSWGTCTKMNAYTKVRVGWGWALGVNALTSSFRDAFVWFVWKGVD